MATLKLPPLPGDDASVPELIDHIAMLHKTIENVLGSLGSDNLFEVGGFKVRGDQLTSDDGDVGLSTNDSQPVGENVRIWAGNATKTTAPFRVYDDGHIIIQDATISWGDGVTKPSYTAADVGALASDSPRLTYIGPDGIYTGTLTANKILVGELNGFTITGATINGGTINVDTTVQVGDNIYIGDEFSTALKQIVLNGQSLISANGDTLTLSAPNLEIHGTNLDFDVSNITGLDSVVTIAKFG